MEERNHDESYRAENLKANDIHDLLLAFVFHSPELDEGGAFESS